MLQSRRERYLLASLLIVYVILSVTYNVMLPLFEAPDEADHYRFARWLTFGQAYPDLYKDAGNAGHEIWQTPLYYYLVSPVVKLTGGGEPYDVAPFNPGYTAGYSRLVHVHTAAETFPYTGTSLAVHLMRLITTGFGIGVILTAYGLARIVWPRVALVAAALVAFNSEFIFMSSVISNDVPAACLAGLTIWWLFRGFQPTITGKRWLLVLGVFWGLAILTKLNNVVLAVPIGLSLLLMNWPLRQLWRRALLDGLLIAAPVVLIAGWWFVLNQVRYQDWLAWQPMLNMVDGLQRAHPLNWGQALAYSTGLLATFWLTIGYGFRGPDIFYAFFNLVLLTTVLGLGFWFWTQLRQHAARVLLQVGMLGAWVIAAYISLLQWMRFLTATDHGRLLFPVMSGLAVLLAIGLTQWRWRRFSLAPLAIGGLLLCAVATPWVVIQPAYAQPSVVPTDAVLPNARTIELGGEVALRGFQIASDRLDTPGGLPIDFYWTSVKPPTLNYIARVTLVDQTARTPAILDAMPFEGRYSTTLWQPGEVLHDHVLVPVPAQTQSRLVTAYLSLYPIGKGRDLIEAVENGEALGRYVELGKVKLRGLASTVQPQQANGSHLGNELELMGFDAPTRLEASMPVSLTLYWRAMRQPADDYTVFVHLLGPDGTLVAQADNQPQMGQYPTSYWDAGEQVSDPYALTLPAGLSSGDYRLQVGMYRLATGERLSASQADGGVWPDNSILLKAYHVP
ncbi:MAG TPA: glycosyltransferase family 39 protein [Anaerolineae bacterium]|nr:glycosyltransferase family 39 protein [Anaerolineae bacterium]